MRRVLAAAAFAFFIIQPAMAQDWLRGSSVITPPAPAGLDWSGFYFGGQGSYVIGETKFSNNIKPLVADMLRLTTLESEQHVSDWPVITQAGAAHSTGYGGFVGYNTRWEDVILGLELNYTSTNYDNRASGSISRIVTLSDQFEYDVTVIGQSRMQVTDIMTLRGRGGYAFGQFLPYLTAGLAFGRANYSDTAILQWTTNYIGSAVPAPTNPCPTLCTDSETRSKNNAIAYGFAFGAGVDVAIAPHVFLRADYEFTQFTNINTSLNNARVGIGLRF